MQLLLMRHAKSDWSHDVEDAARPLNERGRLSADVMARALLAEGLIPELVLVSPAIRTQETLARMLDVWRDAALSGGPSTSSGAYTARGSTPASPNPALCLVAHISLPQVEVVPSLYLASAGQMLALIHALPFSAQRVMVLGHNDGTEVLARRLVDVSASSPEALRGLAAGFKTACVAVYEVLPMVEGGHANPALSPWESIDFSALALTHFLRPRDLLAQG